MKGANSPDANRNLVEGFHHRDHLPHLKRTGGTYHRCCHYTTMNPVRAGLCERPEDWRWSSLCRGTN